MGLDGEGEIGDSGRTHMIRKRHTTAQWVGTTLAFALAVAILFAVFAPIIAVPVAVMIESAAANPGIPGSKAGVTFVFGFFWMGVWMAMALVPGAGFAVAGWLPFWIAGAKRMGIRKLWLAMTWGALAGSAAVLVFLFVEGFAALPGGDGKWSNAVVSGSVAGASLVGAGLFLVTLRFMPRVRQDGMIAAMAPVIPAARQPVDARERDRSPVLPKAEPTKPEKAKKDPDLKWTDWGKVWKPPGEDDAN
jgi:hypothetical protein